MTVIVGIDPGGATTGFAVIDTRRPHGKDLLAATLIRREDPLDSYRDAIRETIAQYRTSSFVVDLWAVEGLVHPHPKMGLANVSGLITTARVIGWLDVWLAPSPTIEIRPAKHGSGPLKAYPPDLVGKHEKRGTGKMRHARSAYDVAHAAHGLIAAS